MLTELRESKLITSTEIRDFDVGQELAHRTEFIRYLREIPPTFLSLAQDPKKSEIVRDHLKNLYKKKPEKWEVDTVLDRVLNLAQYTKGGRDVVEDKAAQYDFKRQHWEHVKRCGLCGHEFQTINDVSLDHIIPLSFGGPERSENWQLTCKLCNVQKDGYWGCSDISRVETFRKVQGRYFNLTGDQILTELMAPKNPTRYWILERDLCKCSECHLTSEDEKLVIGNREKEFLITIESLATYCVVCVKKKKIPHSK